jgi:hypothetical protein
MRIYDSHSDPHDFCRDCAPSEAEADETFDTGEDGPDERGNCYGYDCEHPPYDDPSMYRCEECDRVLTDKD